MKNKFWPNNRDFAFTIIDDTDNSNLENAPLVYDYLKQKKIFTTKSVWTKDGENIKKYNSVNGETLANEKYLNWVKNLEKNSFEICLHSSSWSRSTREEIIKSFEFFENYFGKSSTLIQHNDSRDCESIYWGKKRLVFPINLIFEIIMYITPGGLKSNIYQGEIESSPYFWGDICKEKVDFIRNLTFNEINLFNITKSVLHKRKGTKYVNHWFISSEAPNHDSFVNILSKENLDLLEKQNGLCIIYTHFGNKFVANGKLKESFKDVIDDLSKRNGWFVPANNIFKYLQEKHMVKTLSYFEELKLSYRWLLWKIFHGTS